MKWAPALTPADRRIWLRERLMGDVRIKDRRHIAYMLATAWHETKQTYDPWKKELYDGPDKWPAVFGKTEAQLREKYGHERTNRWIYFEEKYGPESRNAKKYGNVSVGDGELFAGRGYAHLTWHDNYKFYEGHLTEKFQKPVPLLADPDLACEPEYALEIMVHGMLEGRFTGRRLPEFIYLGHVDYLNSRRVVNVLDDADLIAGRAKSEMTALGQYT